MKLSDLLAALPWQVAPPTPAADPEITALRHDSREVIPGALFVAYRGVAVDGHRYIEDALARGAAAVVGTAVPADVAIPVPYVQVGEARAAYGYLCAAWHDYPSRRMTVLGVTGTDGKTTASTLLAAMLRAAGHKVSAITTVHAMIGDRTHETGLHTTTPPAHEVQHYLREMVEAGTSHAVLEVTSEGLSQHRVTGVDFDVAVITNITHDHLYAHGTLEAYRDAKARLFRGLENAYRKTGVPKVAVINADDESVELLRAATQFLKPPSGICLTYAVEQRPDAPVDLHAEDLELEPARTRFVLRSTHFGSCEIESALTGRYNVSNILAAAAAALALGASPQDISEGVAAVKSIPGRMERIDAGQDFAAIVDFAHTANALDQSLASARALVGPGGRLIAVFGAAGERDRLKRPLMGRAAARHADLLVLTAEDPRTETAEAIIDAIAEGCEAEGKRDGESYWRVPDRREAIRHAVSLARAGDVLVLCGKGHEQSMNFGGTETPWDDREALREVLEG